jgi:hypothetical protein
VLLFVFYLFTPGPMLFNAVHDRALRDGPRAADYAALEARHLAATAARREAGARLARADDGGRDQAAADLRARDADVRAVRGEALALVRAVTGDAAFNDVNYVFPHSSPPTCRLAWWGC